MTTDSFPNDPSRRRAVLVLQDHDIDRCKYEPGESRKLLDEEAYVLPFPLRMQGEIPVALQNIVSARLARPGNMLVQSPYDDDSYEEASLAPQRFALAKHMYFSTLCMHLGAKEVVVEQIDLSTRSGKSTLNVTGSRLGASAQASVTAEELEKFRAQMHLRDEFEGGPADVSAAEDLLRRTGLGLDQNMSTLVDLRRGSSNLLKTRKIVLSLSNEAKSNLNVVGRLSVPQFVTLSAEYDRVVKEKQEYTLTVEVRF
jgi:hypothetical protein